MSANSTICRVMENPKARISPRVRTNPRTIKMIQQPESILIDHWIKKSSPPYYIRNRTCDSILSLNYILQVGPIILETVCRYEPDTSILIILKGSPNEAGPKLPMIVVE